MDKLGTLVKQNQFFFYKNLHAKNFFMVYIFTLCNISVTESIPRVGFPILVFLARIENNQLSDFHF